MIKNLLFDLGGVIMDIRRSDCVASFKRLGMTDPDRFLGEYSQGGIFGQLEEGVITPGQWRDALRPELRPGVTDAEIDAAFLDFLVGIPVERLRALERLRESYRIYMLSNTNALMWDTKIADEFKRDGHDREYYFDGIVTSFDVHALKPDPAIFQAVVDRLAIRPEETLFFDDSQANVEAARRIGFEGVTVVPGTEFYNYKELN